MMNSFDRFHNMRWLNGKQFFSRKINNIDWLCIQILVWQCVSIQAESHCWHSICWNFSILFPFMTELECCLPHTCTHQYTTHTLAAFCSPINKFMYFVCMHPFKLDSNWPNRWSNNTVASILVFVRYGWNWVYVTQKEHFQNLI